MKKLFVDRSIEIEASPEKVWKAFTEKKYMDKLAEEFSAGMHEESDWKLGSLVLWRDKEGKVVVEGIVTAIKPYELLSHTVIDIETKDKTDSAEEGGITYMLSKKNRKTILRIMHGDFSAMKEGRKFYKMTLEAWNRILPKIKDWAENMP